eukprot:1133533-Pelagomonas_calceolata.AAC.6
MDALHAQGCAWATSEAACLLASHQDGADALACWQNLLPNLDPCKAFLHKSQQSQDRVSIEAMGAKSKSMSSYPSKIPQEHGHMSFEAVTKSKYASNPLIARIGRRY